MRRRRSRRPAPSGEGNDASPRAKPKHRKTETRRCGSFSRSEAKTEARATFRATRVVFVGTARVPRARRRSRCLDGHADAGYPAGFLPTRLSGSHVRCSDRFTISLRRYTSGTFSAGTTGAMPRTAVLASSPSPPAPRPRSRFAGARAFRGPCRASLEPQKGNTRFTKLRAPARPDPACAAFFSRSTHNITQQHILTRVASRTPHLRRPFLFSPRRCQRASREAPVDR